MAVPSPNKNDAGTGTYQQQQQRLEFCKNLPFPYLTITMYAPTAGIGGVIGKRGSKIAALEKQATSMLTEPISRDQVVRVSIVHHQTHHHHNHQQHNTNSGSSGGNGNSPSNNDIQDGNPPSAPTQGQQQQQQPQASIVPTTFTELDFSSPEWTPIVIKSAPAAALFVATTIDTICSEFVNDPKNDLLYVFDLPISYADNKKLAAIIGKRGQTIGKLSADNECRIFIPPRQRTTANVIQLEAPLENCMSCLQDLGELFSQLN